MSSLQLSPRTVTGKQLKALRKQGLVPATLYGPGFDSVSVQLPRTDFRKVFLESGFSELIDAEIEGHGKERLLLKEVQIHPVTDEYISASFYVINRKKAITADVPLSFVGESPAERENVGFVSHAIETLSIHCLPDNLPKEIEVDISVLVNPGDTISISDVKLPEGVELTSDMDPTGLVCKVEEPQKVEEILAAADAAAAEGAETPEGEAEAGAAEGGEAAAEGEKAE